MKPKYLLFAGYVYYARGGANDYLGAFDSIEAANEYGANYVKAKCYGDYGWWHIALLNDAGMQIVEFHGEAHSYE